MVYTLKAVKINEQHKYSLIDKFHIFSKKKCLETSFRNPKYLIDFIGNTSVAEQQNALMVKDR